MNETDIASPELLHDVSRASGANIFWCLMALAFSCMVQQSFTGCVWGKGTFKDTIWPQRSSPLFCLLDSLIDIFGPEKLFYPRGAAEASGNNDGQDASSERTTQGDEGEQAESTAITMRLAIFFLSVVPQAIQIFSMRGIILTQLIAAAFCVSATTNTVCNLRRASSKTIRTLSAGKRLRELPYLRTTKWQPLGRFNTLALLPISLHLALLFCACGIILKRGRPLDIPHDSFPPWASDEMALLPHTLIYILAFIQSGYIITNKVPSVLFVCLGAGPFAFLLIAILDVKNQEKYRSNFINGLRILIWLCMACLFISWLLKSCACRFARERETQSNGPADYDLEAPPAVVTATTRRQSIDVTETIFEQQELAINDSPGNHSISQTPTVCDQSNSSDAELADQTESEVRSEETLPLSSDAAGPHDVRRNIGKSKAQVIIASLLSSIWSVMGSVIMWICRETDPEAFKRYPKWRRPVSYTALLILRYHRAIFELYWQSWRDIGACLRARSGDEIWMAFGLLNVVTAAIYYLLLFDNEGTSAPSWSNLFG